MITEASQVVCGTWARGRFEASVCARLAEIADVWCYESGAEVLAEGQPADFLGIVGDGRLAVRIRLPDREARTIQTLEPGDIFGWSAIVPPHVARSGIVAVLPSCVARLDGRRLRELLVAEPTIAAAFYPLVLETVSRRLEATNLQLLDLYQAEEERPW